MRQFSAALLIVVVAMLPMSCRKATTASGPLAVVIVIGSGGQSMTLRLDGADGAEVTNPPADKHIRATLTKPGIVTVDAALFKSTPPLFAITMEIDNPKELQMK